MSYTWDTAEWDADINTAPKNFFLSKRRAQGKWGGEQRMHQNIPPPAVATCRQ